jgi:cell wall-associated NlpC family hydrolase
MGLAPFDRLQVPDFTNRRQQGAFGFADQLAKFADRAQGPTFAAPVPSLRPADPFQQESFINDFVGRRADANTGFLNDFVGGAVGGALEADNKFVNLYPGQQGVQGPAGDIGAMGGGGQAGTTGVAALDAHNNEFNAAASRLGAPANLLKAMVNRESSGNWARDGNRVAYLQERNDYILPFVGITKRAADAWGLNWNAMIGNKQAQIDGMATIVSGLAKKYGGFDNAIKVYFMGPAALNGNVKDENGLESDYYYQQAKQNWQQWDQAAGYSGGYGDGATGSSIVSKALEYVGVPYVWGSLPAAGDDPWQTGWDCSAFVNWLDDKYGANELPAGSHYQYQDTVDKGLLINDSNQLQSGDLVFFDTGNTAGGGANLNRAGHVGMYIGNGQFVQAANPGAGTIVSSLSDYMQKYAFLGGRRMGWSGGGGATQQAPAKFSSIFQKYLMAA